jgi:tRNA(fMet)-specific endonuclease VapC
MVCLDTSFIVDVLRGEQSVDSLLEKYDESEEDIFVASPSIMEIVKGAYLKLESYEEVGKIREFLTSVIVLDFDKECAFKAGEIEARLRKEGNIIEIEDIMIGAVAQHNGESLVTRNVKHFSRIEGLEVEGY